MFSICLKGAAILDGALMISGDSARTRFTSTIPDLSTSWKEPSPSGSPSTPSIHARASASSFGSYFAAALSASSLSMPYSGVPSAVVMASATFVYVLVPELGMSLVATAAAYP